MQAKQDVLIIGSGIVGMSMALALAPQGHRITLLDRQIPVATAEPQTNARVYAITRQTEAFFRALGVWSRLSSTPAYREMLVWDTMGSGRLHFDCQTVGQSALGYILSHAVITTALLEQLAQCEQVQLQQVQQLQSYQCDQGGVVLRADDRLFEARLGIGADGAQSWLRTQLGIESVAWDYAQDALYCVIESEHPHGQVARQCFMPDGPLAFLPLADPNHCAIVWSVIRDKARTVMQLSDQDFCAALTEFSAEQVGAIRSATCRQQFPLKMHHAKRYSAPRTALIGDAIHSIHPLAGQGLNVGLADAYVLQHALKQTKGFGSQRGIRRFERQRKVANWKMILLMEGFKQVFGYTGTQVTRWRNLGLTFCDQRLALKRWFIQQAQGRQVLPGL